MSTQNQNNIEKPDLTNVYPGYRNISYHVTNGKGEIVLDGWDKDKVPKTFYFPHLSKVVYETKEKTDTKTLFDTYAQTRYFNNSYERKKWLASIDKNINIIEAFKPEQEFLVDNFYDKVYDNDFNVLDLRTHFIDIEVAIETEFCKPTESKYPINIITVYDTHLKKYYSWALDMSITNTIANKNIELRKFNSEQIMLRDFIEWFSVNRPDIISGWNIYFFDMPYLLKRVENVLGKTYCEKFSSIKRYWFAEKKDKFNSAYVNIPGVSQLDLLILYRDKFKVNPSLDGGYNLDNVAFEELGENKIKYEGSMRNFYKNNFQRFWEYNIKDVELCVKIEAKRSLIPSARRITTLGLCQYEQIYGSINYIIGSVCIYSKNHHNKIFRSYTDYDNIGEEFEGAYVFPTMAAFYKNGCACIDVNSLYPNTMIALNLSPETKIGQLIDNLNGTFNIVLDDGTIKIITAEVRAKLLETKCILSKNDTLFYKHSVKKGILSGWCKYYFDRRKHYQKLAKAAGKKIEELETQLAIKKQEGSDYSAIDKELAEQIKYKMIYHTTQYAIKIMLNSAYGMTGTKFSPIYDINLAQSITLNGQFVNKSVATYLKKKFNEKYKCSEDFEVTISGDTDSVAGDTILNIRIGK